MLITLFNAMHVRSCIIDPVKRTIMAERWQNRSAHLLNLKKTTMQSFGNAGLLKTSAGLIVVIWLLILYLFPSNTLAYDVVYLAEVFTAMEFSTR